MRNLNELMKETEKQREDAQNVVTQALSALAEDGPVWAALHATFELAIAEANDAATHPDTAEEKRAGWCARERGLRDLWAELEDLRSGDWKHWQTASRVRGREQKE